jgi:hypothetical protein
MSLSTPIWKYLLSIFFSLSEYVYGKNGSSIEMLRNVLDLVHLSYLTFQFLYRIWMKISCSVFFFLVMSSKYSFLLMLMLVEQETKLLLLFNHFSCCTLIFVMKQFVLLRMHFVCFLHQNLLRGTARQQLER